MSPRAAQYRMLWRAALGAASPRTPAILLWSTVLVTTVSAGLAWKLAGAVTALGWGAGTLAVLMLFAWGTLFTTSAVELNTPANARLVPGARARMIELTAGVWCGAMALLAASLLLLAHERTGLVLVWVTTLTLATALGFAGLKSTMILGVPAFIGPVVKDFLPAPLLAALAHPVAPWVVLALLPPVGLAAAHAILPQAGERHWERMAARRKVEAALQGRYSSFEGWPEWMQRALQRLSRRRAARRGTRSLLMLALGPDARALTFSFLVGGMFSLGMIILLTKTGVLGRHGEVFRVFDWRMASLVMLLFLFQVAAMPAALARTRGEQAMLRLAPAMPVARAGFNRLVAAGQLWQACWLWIIVSGGALLLAWMAGGDAAVLLEQGALCCMTLPALALVLRDHARPPRYSAFLLALAALGLSLVGPVIGVLAARLLGLPGWPSATAAALVLAAVLLRLRWRLALDAPVAFPAGRLD